MVLRLQLPFANRSYYWVNEWAFDGSTFWNNRFSTGRPAKHRPGDAFTITDLGLVRPSVRVVEPIRISVNMCKSLNPFDVETESGKLFLEWSMRQCNEAVEIFQRLWQSGGRYLFNYTAETETLSNEFGRYTTERIKTEYAIREFPDGFDREDFKRILKAFDQWRHELDSRFLKERTVRNRATKFFQLANTAAKLAKV